MPAYNKRAYTKSARVTIRGVVKRPYRQSGGSGRGTPMQIVTSGLAPLRTGGFFGTRRTIQEKKTVDVNYTAAIFTTAGAATLMNGIAAGTDFTDRIGRKVILKSLFFRFYIVPEDQSIADNPLRIMLVYDRQTNGAAPAVLDVLKEANPMSQLNLNNRDRFQVLWDKSIIVPFLSNTATQSVCGGQTTFIGKKFKRLNHEMIFGGTAATVASIQTGSIYLITVGFSASPAGATIGYTNRIRFMDA